MHRRLNFGITMRLVRRPTRSSAGRTEAETARRDNPVGTVASVDITVSNESVDSGRHRWSVEMYHHVKGAPSYSTFHPARNRDEAVHMARGFAEYQRSAFGIPVKILGVGAGKRGM